MFQMRFKCFKYVANYSIRVANICTALYYKRVLLIPEKKYVSSISHRTL